MKLELLSRSAAETRKLGRMLGRHARPGDWLGLGGELGAGKTTLVQGLARGAGVPAQTAVVSPTFVIFNIYRGRLPVYHFDFYRLRDADELFATGYNEFAQGDGLCVVEWYERIPEAVSETGLLVDLVLISEKQRRLSFRACGEQAASWLARLARSLESKRAS